MPETIPIGPAADRDDTPVGPSGVHMGGDRKQYTSWAYPMPLGAYGSLGWRGDYGFDHVKIETFTRVESDAGVVERRISKRFSYRHRADGAAVWRKPGWADSVPYRARELRLAVLAGADIWVCEGESDADALVELGLVATTSHRGAEGWTPAMAEWFTGWGSMKTGGGRGRVTICADADPTGAYVAAKTYDLLADSGVYPSALRVVVPAAEVGVELGADVRDHVAAGYGAADFEEVDLAVVREVAAAHVSAVGTRAGGSGPHRGGDGGSDVDGGEAELRALLEHFGWNKIKG